MAATGSLIIVVRSTNLSGLVENCFQSFVDSCADTSGNSLWVGTLQVNTIDCGEVVVVAVPVPIPVAGAVTIAVASSTDATGWWSV